LNGDLFWRALTNEIEKQKMLPNRQVQILPAGFKEYASVIGSVALVLDAVLGLKLR